MHLCRTVALHCIVAAPVTTLFNLALGRPTWQSVTAGYHPSNLAVDGKTNTNSGFGTTYSAALFNVADQLTWWAVDLARVVLVDYVNVTSVIFYPPNCKYSNIFFYLCTYKIITFPFYFTIIV